VDDLTQLQGAAVGADAGIVVPKSIIESGEIPESSTRPLGGVIYSLAHGGRRSRRRPPLGRGDSPCAFPFPPANTTDLAKSGASFCLPANDTGRPRRSATISTCPTTKYAQASYILGENGYVKLVPKAAKADQLTWSKYHRASCSSIILSSRNRNGSWSGGYIANVTTANLSDYPATGERIWQISSAVTVR